MSALCLCSTILTYLLILLTLLDALLDSLEFKLSGELVLSLLQFLSAPHVLVVHVLDLRFDALELGIQLQAQREREANREGEEERSHRVQCSI